MMITHPLSSRLALGTAWTAIGLALALMTIRLVTTLVTPEPTQALTSSAEYESLYAMWTVAHGLPVHADPTRIPFAGAHDNWLYYVLYGGVLRLAGWSDVWIPTLCKLVTVAGVLTGLGLSWGLGRRLIGPVPPELARMQMLVWLLVFLGPLMGFWAMSTAPDIWALALDAASVLAFLFLYDRRPRAAVAAFLALAYLAWSVKQVFVYSMGGVGLFLLLRRDWRGAVLLVLGMAAAWAATLGLGTPDFRRGMFFGGPVLQPAQALRNGFHFVVKSSPLILGTLAVAAVLPRTWWRAKPLLAVPALCAVVAVLPSGVAGGGPGAGGNSFFALSFHLALFLLAGLAELERAGGIPGGVWRWLGAGWLVTAMALLAPFAGISGTLSVRAGHDARVQASTCIGTRPGPVFADSPGLALPWLTPSEPAFVPYRAYPRELAAGVPMEGGGIGGLVASGYFATLILGNGRTSVFGVSALENYVPVQDCGPMVIYRRR